MMGGWLVVMTTEHAFSLITFDIFHDVLLSDGRERGGIPIHRPILDSESESSHRNCFFFAQQPTTKPFIPTTKNGAQRPSTTSIA